MLRFQDARPLAATPRSGPGRAAKGAGRSAQILLPIVLFGAVWWLVTELQIWEEVFVPRPAAVWDRFIQSVTTHDGNRGLSDYFLWEHLWASLWRIIQGIGWALVVGVPLGLALATVRPFAVVVEPYVNFVRALPPLAYFSLLIIWFGIEDTSKIWLLFLAAVAPITLSVIAGVRGVRQDALDAARSMGASRRQVALHVQLPAALPELVVGLRLAIGFAFTTIVAAETANGIPGIGGLAWSTKKFQQTDVAVLCILAIGLTAILLDHLVQVFDRAFVPWRGKA
ncbi:MAG TPA: ABC transporter permease [Acidimicrobiales bacterium]